MFARFAIPAPDSTSPDQLHPDDFRGCPEAAEAWERGTWSDIGEDDPVSLSGQADGWA